MQVQDIDLLLVDDPQHRGQGERIELPAFEIGDVDPEGVQGFFREILLPQADQGHVEARPVEAGDHPAEQSFDAVHARPFPPEVVADLQDVERSIGHEWSLY